MISELVRVRKEAIRASLDVNNTEEHRLESVYKINGVQYINDAGAQSVNATFYSIESIRCTKSIPYCHESLGKLKNF